MSNIHHFIFKGNRIDKFSQPVYAESIVKTEKGAVMNQNDLSWERVRTWLLWLALPLVIGLLLASLVPQPVIGIIRLEDAIYSYTARDMIKQIEYASEHPEVRAVVLVLDSPGGTVVDTEAVYLELAKLREKKPVVTVINSMAASGAYYLSVGTDYIYSKPSSLVGNIGVISYLPPVPMIFEEIISTGPYKLWGAARDSEMRQADAIKEAFLEAVVLGRGQRLKAEPEVITSGQIWMGNEAVRLGFADELGTESDALDKAAELARVANYETAELRELAGIVIEPYVFFVESPQGFTTPYPTEPGMYMLFIPEIPVEQ
jgi:protease-4